MDTQLFQTSTPGSPWTNMIRMFFKGVFFISKNDATVKNSFFTIDVLKEMTKWICRDAFFIENVEIMKKCGKEMIKGALRLYINDFIRIIPSDPQLIFITY